MVSPPIHRSFLCATIASFALLGLGRLAACAAQPGGSAPAADRPNILILLVDDLQPDAVGALGNERVRTPHIDRLARRGVAFTGCHIQGSVHGAVCAPSRAMLLTGRHLWRRGGDGCGDHPLWSETFRRAGYSTFVTGKWHNGRQALERGFEHIGETGPGMYPSTPVGGDAYERPAEGNVWDPADETRAGHWLEREGRVVHSSEHWTDEAVAFLEGHARRGDASPFFLYVSYHAPHDPRQAPRRFVEMYPPAEIPLPPNFLPAHPFDQGTLTIRDELLAPTPRTEAAVRLHGAEYYAIVSHLDEQIGRLLGALERAGHAEDTIVIFTSDNGLALGRHGLLGKQNLYEHSVRVPLIVSGPGISAGARSGALVYLHDLFPTTCEMTGIEIPSTVDAKSFVPLLRAPAGDLRDTIFAAYASDQRMVRDRRYKLILYPNARRIQLFDLDEDPHEMNNLAVDPAHRATIRRLYGDMLRWMDRAEDPLDRDLIAEPWSWSDEAR